MTFSTQAEFDEAYRSVRAAFASGTTKDKRWRRRQLQQLWWMIEDNMDQILAALLDDLHKSAHESMIADIAGVQADLLETIKMLDKWTADERPSRTSLINYLGNGTVRKEPLGVTIIIGAWNFPILLLLQPMVAAIAAGCAMILKPSDLAVECQNLLVELIPKYMDQNAIRCISAGPSEMGYILEHRFDHIFYTGSAKVAKIIHAAAAKNLTPVTLELGGQGPAIVTESANIDLTAKRIASTKFTNAGQICLNVNHILVHPSVREALVAKLIEYFDIFKGGKDQAPDYYTRIINDRNFQRLESLLEQSSGKMVYGGERDATTRYFAPTIVVGVKPDDSLMTEELFGPILPIIDADLDAALEITRSMEHPLAIYAFANAESEKNRVLNETASGGVTFNDCVLHASVHEAPFGGMGHAGIGYYHGHYGILAFSHLRTHVQALPNWMEGLMDARYPPYTPEKTKKIASPLKAPFNRDGSDSTGTGVLAKLGFLVAAVALVASYASPQKWFQ